MGRSSDLISKPAVQKKKIKKTSRADNDRGSVTQDHGTKVLGKREKKQKN